VKKNQTVDFDQYVKEVRRDHYLHRVCLFGIAIWAGYKFGVWWGLVALIFLIAVIAVSNLTVLALGQSYMLVRINRWAWLMSCAILTIML
jgi:hypothetical protein